MSNKTPLSNYRNNFIDLSELYGVDLTDGTFTPDDRFKNVKVQLRPEVLESLALCDNPANYESKLLIYQSDDGRIHILDGFHRLTNSLINYLKLDKSVWGRIPYELFRGTDEDAQFEMVKRNLEDPTYRSYLTPQEEMFAVMRWIDSGYTTEEILKRLGRNPQNVTWVNKVGDIRSKGIFPIEQAVANNEIDITTAAKIARKPTGEQKEALDKAIAAVQEGKSVTEVRDAAGVKKNMNQSMMNRSEVLDYLFSIYDEGFASAYEKGEIDDNLLGQVMAIMSIVRVPDGPMADRFEYVDDMYLKHVEKTSPKSDKPKKKSGKLVAPKAGKPKRQMKAPWQV